MEGAINRTTQDPAGRRQPDATSLLAQARRLLDSNQRAAAIALCQRVADSRPDRTDILYKLGVLHRRLGNLDAALHYLRRAVAQRPDLPAIQVGLAIVLQAIGRFADALVHYDFALDLRPDDAEALSNRGLVLQTLRRHDTALQSYDRALALRPDLAAVHYNRGNLLRHMQRPADALAGYDQALALQPDFMEAMNNRGVALQLLNRHADALEAHDQALMLRPDDADALNNRAAALLVLNRHAEALACHDRALALQPDFWEAHIDRAYGLLAMGDYAHGWAEHEWRWKMPALAAVRRDLPQPSWLGESDCSGKTILLWAEQGFGDTIQFCRFVPLVAARAKVVLEVPRPLLRLLSSLPGSSQIIAQGQERPPFDLHCPLMSLPLALGTVLETIPNEVPYLAANPADVPAWRQRMSGLTGLRVGIVWAGNPWTFDAGMRAVDQRRSCTLAQFAPLAAIPGIDLISLQKGAPAAQARTPPHGMVVRDWTEHMHDFADTAALIEALDLVIGVDTSVVHVAGALGKPVWVLSRFDACWRWLIDREDSPWYPTARIFRQPQPGDWTSVMSRVAGELRGRVVSQR